MVKIITGFIFVVLAVGCGPQKFELMHKLGQGETVNINELCKYMYGKSEAKCAWHTYTNDVITFSCEPYNG